MKKRILTGDRPTGRLHLGHYVGSLKNRTALQDEYDLFVMMANVQALTDNFNKSQKVRDSIAEVVKDNLAVGVDPKKATIFVQSQVPEIAELTIFFLNLVSLSRLKLNPTVKDEMKQKGFGDEVPVGFLIYPISQAADILFLKADLVPVGEDQSPMIEQSREIARRFNSLYGNVFPEPKGLIGDVGRLVGMDGQAKMSKSLDNAIYLSDSSDEVKRKVMSMYTDPKRIRPTDPGTVEGNPVFVYHDAFNENKGEVEDLKDRYRNGKVGDVEVKEKLFVALEEFLAPIRERRVQISDSDVSDVLDEGLKRVKPVARETIEEVRAAMKLPDFS